MSGDRSPLRVTLDVSAVPAAPAGAGRYTLDLAAALARRSDVDLILTARRHDGSRWHRLVGDGAGGPPGRVLTSAPGPRLLRLAWEQARLPALLDSVAPDVHHGPHYTMPERARVPVVVTVHDCTFFDHPEWHERSKVRVFRRAIGVAARRAAAVVCVSRTTAERLAAVCEVRAPVFIAPHGVDHTRFTPAESAPGADDSALGAIGLGDRWPFIVFVGTVEPRKNVPALVRAFERLAPGHPGLRLVIAGQDGWGGEEVEKAIAAAGVHRDRVVRTGYVSDAAVPALLRRAAAVAYPSFEEGYGLPALEALACGAPLVTTAGTAMAELAGNAALLVPAGDTEDLAAALASVLDEPPGSTARAGRRERGLAVAAARTWEASAEAHLVAYRHAAGRPQRGSD